MAIFAQTFVALFLLLPTNTKEVGSIHPPQHDALAGTQDKQVLPVASRKRNLTDGVSVVLHARGEFRKTGPNRWSENGGQFKLRQVEGASGGKFANDDYTVWLKGGNAMLEFDGNIDNCTGR